MIELIALALIPIVGIGTFVYIRDSYDREPVPELLKALALGAVSVVPILITGYFISPFQPQTPPFDAAYRAFITAAANEEIFKLLALAIVFKYNRHFNERFDGIVYGVFVSLGFAAVENIMYVTSYGPATAITRALTAVPAHAMFGVFMGYHFARYQFKDPDRPYHLFAMVAYPIFWHGVYDFILMSSDWVQKSLLVSGTFIMVTFVVFLIYAHRTGLKRFSRLRARSRKRWTGKT